MAASYYTDSHVTLYHADCLTLMSDWANEYANPDFGQIVVTSPPYNMGLTPGGNGRGMYQPSGSRKGGRFRHGYEEHHDAMPQSAYDQWQRDTLAVVWEITPDDGAIYYNHKQRIEHGRIRMPLEMEFGIPLRQIITWDRGTGIGVNRRHYCSSSEFIFMFAKPSFKLRDHAASGAGDVWRLGMATEDYGHPAPFPLSLPLKAITTSAARSVLDPFCGTGTTLAAAKAAGIRGIGIEASERYCEVAARRLSQGVFDFDDSPVPVGGGRHEFLTDLDESGGC